MFRSTRFKQSGTMVRYFYDLLPNCFYINSLLKYSHTNKK